METRRAQKTTEELPSSSLMNNCGGSKNVGCNAGDNGEETQRNDTTSSAVLIVPEPRRLLVWRKPWVVAVVLFSVFFVLWAYLVVIKRYWIDERFEAALPGLATSALRKVSMRLHMTFGALAIACSLIQMITPFTSGWKRGKDSSTTRNFYRRVHRYMGRIYVLCCIMAFFFGQWFIILKEFILVGGYNMGISFSLAGFAIAYFAYMTWKTAPSNNADGKYTIEDHRNYAIRSFSQIIAPILYRYWYVILMMLKIYRTPYLNGGNVNKGENLICDDRNVCRDYLRPFDAVYCWLYWISAWIVAEIIIACLPMHQAEIVTTEIFLEGDAANIPLLTNLHPTTDENSQTEDTSRTCTTGSDSVREENSSSCPIANESISAKANVPIASVVNFFGCLLAVLAAMGTFPMLYLVASSILKKSQGTSASS